MKRSDGQNVVARAAYIARERLVDERTGRVYDYRFLGEPERKATFAPEEAPVWAVDRQLLWNAVERKEDQSTRPDQAQLARDLKIALPHELNIEQRRMLVNDFAREMVAKGMVVDVAIHTPDPKGDDRNFHVHMLCTMRSIEPEGFGNKVREWNKTAELERWRERWSELGANHLDRAGFDREAERFRHGHLTLAQQRRHALERGDHEWAEKLDRAPKEHMGPYATAAERQGLNTRKGEINRDIESQNRVGGVWREIREAYLLNRDPHAFTEALIDKNLMLARITKDDARRSFSFTHRKYQHREGDYVIATEQGSVYWLSKATTGDSFKNIRAFTKPLDQQDYPSLDAALQEMRKRSMIPRVDRASVIENMMHPVPPSLQFPEGVPRTWSEENLRDLAATIPSAPTYDRSQYTTRTSLPDGANNLRLRGDGTQVWWAYNSKGTPEAFHESLKERGLHLVRVTADDARDSHAHHWAAKRQGGYHPLVREGEYLVVNDRGFACRLNDRSVGHEFREVKAFMGKLDSTPIASLREVQASLHEKRMKQIDPHPYEPPIGQKLKRGLIAAARDTTAGGLEIAGAVGNASRLGGRALGFGIRFLESFLAPVLTPEQKVEGKLAEQERQSAADQAERKRRNDDRDR